MRIRTIAFVVTVALSGLTVVISAAPASRPVTTTTWDARAAAAYLDQRQTWWQSWPKAARDHGTVCVSCHTALPYALARPELRVTLHEGNATFAEQKLLADVVTRVRAWKQVKPFYGGDSTAEARQKAIESRGSESVLNALILASRDRRAGAVSADALQAFSNMFALQQTTGDNAGAWAWLDFGLRPWESTTAVYFGAALAAIAVGREPQGYAQRAEVQPNLERLRAYLRTHVDQPLWKRFLRRDDPHLFNRAMLLWASAELPGLLSNEERRSLVTELYAAQDADGGWKLSSLGYWRHAAAESEADGYATGLISYALEQTGTPANNEHLARALAWLAAHQDGRTGMWGASSLNKRRDPATNVGRFMSDAATAFAVLALTRADFTVQAAAGRLGSRTTAALRSTSLTRTPR